MYCFQLFESVIEPQYFPQCPHRWPVTLDIASFFWNEIAVQAKRLCHEVHVLARAYAWREADILAMSERRRQYYLNMVS